MSSDNPENPLLKEIDLEAAEAMLSSAVYAGTALLESLERSEKISGNGHHLRQQLAEQAVRLLRERWRN